MNFALKANFAGIRARDWKWLAERASDEAQAEIAALIALAKSDPSKLVSLRIMFAYLQLQEFLADFLARQIDERSADAARDEWISLQEAVRHKDWPSADRYLELLNARLELVVYVEKNLPVIKVAEQIKTTRTKAADTTNSKRKIANVARNARIEKLARLLILADEADMRTVSATLVRTGQAADLQVKAVREILRNAGVIVKKTGVR